MCKKYSNISSCNVLLIPHSRISLQRASLSAIWKNIMKKYIICLHTSLFIHCRSFIMHSHNSIRLWRSNWGNKTKMPFCDWNPKATLSVSVGGSSITHLNCPLVVLNYPFRFALHKEGLVFTIFTIFWYHMYWRYGKSGFMKNSRSRSRFCDAKTLKWCKKLHQLLGISIKSHMPTMRAIHT